MQDTHVRKFTLVMRSKTTFKTDSETIQVWPGQDVNDVAERIAYGYGAVIVELVEICSEE
jgi:hypothetical protein